MRTIDHLPDETLFAIFEIVLAPTIYNFGRVISLTHVSRRWMVVLRDNGRIWSNIHIHGQDLAMLDAQITLCREAPLFVLIKEAPQSRTKHPRHLNLQANIRGAANLIRQRREQVKRLEVHMDHRTFQQQLGYEWFGLKELVWVEVCPPGSRVHGANRTDLASGVLPRLKVLSVKGGINWSMNVATHLTTFELQGPMNLDLPTLVKFFRKNTSLESLKLDDLDIRGPPASCREKPIELLHLTKLSVHNATCGSLLSLLNLPSLKRLWVFSLKGRNPWSDYNWSKHCSRLSLANLEAQYLASQHERITVFGSVGPGTESLRFTEFSPVTQGATLFESFSNASLPSITSLFLIKDMPEGGVPSSLTAAICNLLEQLPRVERMRLCPSELTVEVMRRLSNDSELCPELRELEVTVTDETRRAVVELEAEVVKVRAGGGDGRKINIKYL